MDNTIELFELENCPRCHKKIELIFDRLWHCRDCDCLVNDKGKCYDADGCY